MRIRNFKAYLLSVIVILQTAPALAFNAQPRSLQFRTVVLSDSPESVGTDQARFQFISSPFLMEDGRLSFSAFDQLETHGDGLGLYTEQPNGTFRLVAHHGQQAPGADLGVSFTDFRGRVAMSPIGDLAFASLIAGPGVNSSNNTGVWSEAGGTKLRLVSRDGTRVDETNLLRVGFDSVSINRDGVTAFNEIIDLGNDAGRSIWTDSPTDGLKLLVKQGDLPAGFSGSAQFSNIAYPQFTSAGEIVFPGAATGSGVNSSNDFGIWTVDSQGQTTIVVREGSRAIGTSGNYRGLLLPIANDNKQVAFTADLTGQSSSPTDGTSKGIWKSDLNNSGQTDLVAAAGMAAPGEPTGVTFSNLFFPEFNDNFQTAFFAQIVGPGIQFEDIGLWSETGSSGLHLVAREGQQAPGFELGVVFDQFHAIAMNSLDQVLFSAAATATEFGTGEGIWVQDRDGKVRLLLRSGDKIDVGSPAEQDLRTVESFRFQGRSIGLSDYLPMGLNGQGELGLQVNFTDGSEGLLVVNTLLVPEPHTLLLFVSALGLLTACCHRAGQCSRGQQG